MNFDFYITGTIGVVFDWWTGQRGTTAAQVRHFLDENKDKEVTIAVSSPGGYLSEGIEICELIKAHGKCNMVVVGMTASAATILCMKAKSVKIAKGSMMLIHNSSYTLDVWTTANKKGIDQIIESFKKYRDDLDTKYPVLYLQHGGGENETCWIDLGKTNFSMDNLLAEGKIVPFIIVMNNAMMQVNNDGNPRLDNSRYNDMIIEDCIPFIESHYRVISDKKARAIAGLSMGSLLSGEMIMQHYDVFGSAGLFTGYTYPKMPGREPRSQAEQLKCFDDAETFNREVNPFFGAIGDHEVSLPLFEQEREYCKEKGINYIQKIYPGYHEWRVWRAAFHDYAQMLFRDI